MKHKIYSLKWLVFCSVFFVACSESIAAVSKIPISKTETEPYPLEVLYQRAAALSSRGLYQDAVTILNRIINEDPYIPEAYVNRGMVMYQRGEIRRAFTDFHKAARIQPGHAAACQGMAMVFYKLGHFDYALNAFKKTFERDPFLGLAYYNRAILYEYMGRHKSSLADLQKADQLGVAVNPMMMRFIQLRANLEDEMIWRSLREGKQKFTGAALFRV